MFLTNRKNYQQTAGRKKLPQAFVATDATEPSGKTFTWSSTVKHQKRPLSEAAELPDWKMSKNQAGKLGKPVWIADTSAPALGADCWTRLPL